MPQDPLQIALEHHRAGRLRQAEAGYRALLDSDPANPDATDGDFVNTEPRLDPLAGYGGPTQTHRLKQDSPAVDAADPARRPRKTSGARSARGTGMGTA